MKTSFKNTKELSETQVYDLMEKFISEMELSTTLKNKYCQFAKDGKERHCSATSCDTCDGCKFFAPTIHGKIRMVAERYYELRKTIANMNLKIRKLNRKIEDLKMDKMDRDFRISVLQERIDSLNEELENYERGE